MRLNETDELSQYRKRIGDNEYRKQYLALYRFAEQSKRRHSGEKYENSKDRLQQIKDKYKNGVTKNIINEMVGIKE